MTDKKEILEMLEKCDTVRMGIQWSEYTDVVPVSFGMIVENEEPILGRLRLARLYGKRNLPKKEEGDCEYPL